MYIVSSAFSVGHINRLTFLYWNLHYTFKFFAVFFFIKSY